MTDKMIASPFRLKNDEENWIPFSYPELEMLIPYDDLSNLSQSMVDKIWYITGDRGNPAKTYPYFYEPELSIIDGLMRQYYSDNKSMTVVLFNISDIFNADEELGKPEYNLWEDDATQRTLDYITNRQFILSHTNHIYSCYGAMSDQIIITNQASPYFDADTVIKRQIQRIAEINSGVSSCSKMLKDMGAKNPYELFDSLINIGKGF